MQIARASIYQIKIDGKDYGRIATAENRETALDMAQKLAETDGLHVRRSEIKLQRIAAETNVHIERIPNRLRKLDADIQMDPGLIKRARSDRETPQCFYPDQMIGDKNATEPKDRYPRCANPAEAGRTTCRLHHSLGTAGRPTTDMYLDELAEAVAFESQLDSQTTSAKSKPRTRKSSLKPAKRRTRRRDRPSE